MVRDSSSETCARSRSRFSGCFTTSVGPATLRPPHAALATSDPITFVAVGAMLLADAVRR